jgi:archaellum biogenesis ATPase FlaH
MQIDLDTYERLIAYRSLTDSTYLNAIADYVKPEYFENQNIAKYFEIVTTFYEKRKVLPTLTEVKTYLTTDVLKKGFKSLIESFKDIEKKLDKDELYQNTEQFLKERATAYQIGLIADDFEETTRNPSKVLAAFEEVCKICLDIEKGLEIYRDVDLIIDDLLNEEAYISTGWDWMDEALGGGWLESGKALYMFAGPANIGKSIVLGNVATNIAKQNKSVLVISLEMSELIYARRMSSNITKIPMSDLKDNTHSLKSLMVGDRNKLDRSRIFIKEFPPSTVTPNQISSFIKKMIDSGERIDAVVIDYVTLLTTTKGSNSYERLKYICEEVRALTYVYKLPIISCCQTNRGSYGVENPGMEGIAESMAVAHVSDVIVSIFQSDEDREMGLIKLGMMKNRYGARGMVQAMKIDYPTLTISQSSEESEIMDDDEMSLLEKFSN